MERRQFIQFLGAGAIVAASTRVVPGWLVARADEAAPRATPFLDGLDFTPVPPGRADTVTLPDGFRHEVLLSRGTVLNPRGDTFGDDNDYLAWVDRGPDEGWLWANHENASPYLLFGEEVADKDFTLQHASTYLQHVGGSCIRIARRPDGQWRPVVPDPRNFRLSGLTQGLRLTGPAAGSEWVHRADFVTGSTSNCGGGVSPWGTFFSGEENWQDLWGDVEMGDQGSMKLLRHFAYPGEHYGYLVECDPDTGEFFKHTALGRFAHENVAFTLAQDGRLVAYLGDDRSKQCIYKFISDEPYVAALGKANRRLLERGTLHVADTKAGRWLPLDPARQPVLRAAGFDRARVCVHTRTAAHLVGGTPHARPEDIEVHPLTGEVFISLTAHERVAADRQTAYFADVAGAIGRIREAGGDAGALEFAFDLFVMGSPETGLAWPDNLAFTGAGHLLVTSDFEVNAEAKKESSQALFGNNFLMVVPTRGPRTGQVLRLATAPCGAEFCSPTLSPDRRELWVNVQHPGGGGLESRAKLLGHWPDGGDALPRSSLIAIGRG